MASGTSGPAPTSDMQLESDPSMEKDSAFWYEDGNVILVSRNVEFRIFKGILAEHSPVFKDMFSLPQPPSTDSSTSPSNPPVVHVSDSPEDLRHILAVCMPKSDSVPELVSPQEPTYDTISALIRLGHKYQMSRLVDIAIKFLKHYYTNDFDEWADRASDWYGPPSFHHEEAIGVIGLARLTDTPSILPTAFLICCTLGPRIVDGYYVRGDRSQGYLSLKDIGRCFGAQQRLVKARIAGAARTFNPTLSRDCKTETDCRDSLRKTLRQFDTCAETLASPDPFVSHMELLKDPLCASCSAMVKERDLKERCAAWERLPDLVGVRLESWNA